MENNIMACTSGEVTNGYKHLAHQTERRGKIDRITCKKV